MAAVRHSKCFSPGMVFAHFIVRPPTDVMAITSLPLITVERGRSTLPQRQALPLYSILFGCPYPCPYPFFSFANFSPAAFRVSSFLAKWKRT